MPREVPVLYKDRCYIPHIILNELVALEPCVWLMCNFSGVRILYAKGITPSSALPFSSNHGTTVNTTAVNLTCTFNFWEIILELLFQLWGCKTQKGQIKFNESVTVFCLTYTYLLRGLSSAPCPHNICWSFLTVSTVKKVQGSASILLKCLREEDTKLTQHNTEDKRT